MTETECPASLQAFGFSSRHEAAIIVAIRRGREDRRLILVRGACPRCGAEQEFRPGGRFVNGRGIPRPHCHGKLALVAAPSRSAS